VKRFRPTGGPCRQERQEKRDDPPPNDRHISRPWSRRRLIGPSSGDYPSVKIAWNIMGIEESHGMMRAMASVACWLASDVCTRSLAQNAANAQRRGSGFEHFWHIGGKPMSGQFNGAYQYKRQAGVPALSGRSQFRGKYNKFIRKVPMRLPAPT